MCPQIGAPNPNFAGKGKRSKGERGFRDPSTAEFRGERKRRVKIAGVSGSCHGRD